MRNLQDMMVQMKKMQEELQQKMDTIRVEASAGGGVVTVQMNGNKKLLSIRIDPEAVKDGDVEMLQGSGPGRGQRRIAQGGRFAEGDAGRARRRAEDPRPVLSALLGQCDRGFGVLHAGIRQTDGSAY